MDRRVAVFLVVSASFFLATCALSSRTDRGDGALSLRAVSFSSLPNWQADAHAAGLGAFLESCVAIHRRNGRDDFGPSPVFAKVSRWQRLCRRAAKVPQTNAAAKAFFEANFQPYAVSGRGTFTGYYEVLVRGSWTRTKTYAFPVYARPSDLTARSPYYSRRQIDQGALDGRGLEVLYLSSAADAFLLHLQGSGAVQLTDGSWTRLSYAANNGYGFRSIAAALRAAGYDSAVEGATTADNRRWLLQNPGKAVGVIQANPRYIFFTHSTQRAPTGAQTVPLTPGRTLAVDRDHIALGTPIYLETQYVDPLANKARRPLQRLVVAQDTGSAINGTVRGDLYWGTGDLALQYAGAMKEQGRYTLLLPL